jgi:hypothetical protein
LENPSRMMVLSNIPSMLAIEEGSVSYQIRE